MHRTATGRTASRGHAAGVVTHAKTNDPIQKTTGLRVRKRKKEKKEKRKKGKKEKRKKGKKETKIKIVRVW